MVANPRASEAALDLFIRPFRREAWIGISVCLSLILGMSILPYFSLRDYFSTNGFRLFAIIGWLFFVLLEIYFSGTLTMFFTSEAPFPFETVEDVIRAYPNWKLKYPKGSEYFIIKEVATGKYINFPA